jgi:hypothetical protein
MELTKEEIDVILNILEDAESMWGLEPEERELKEKLEKEWYKNVSE